MPAPATRPLLRRGLAALLRLTVTLAPIRAEAQALEDIKRYADRITASCDYVKYIDAANKAIQTLNVVADVKQAIDFFRMARYVRGGGILLPITDMFQYIANEGTRRAGEKQLLERKRGIIKQLESACQAYVNAKNMQREYQISAMAGYGILKDMKDVLQSLDFNDALARPDQVLGSVETLIAKERAGVAGASAAQDLLSPYLDSVTTSGLRAADDAFNALTRSAATLDRLKLQLKVYASANRSGRLTCPEDYPALPSVIPPERYTAGGVECGPASPGKARQVQVMMQAIQLEQRLMASTLKANQLSLEAANEVNETIYQRKKAAGKRTSFTTMSAF